MKLSNKRFSRVIVSLLLVAMAASMAATALAENNAAENGTLNSAPIAENRKICTFKGIAVTGEFAATDIDGDPVVFEIVTAPKKGEVINNDDGTFVFTPFDGKKGKDFFTYIACDEFGGVSAEAKIEIDIKKQSTKTVYADMENSSAHYAALALAEDGIFIGEKLGDEYFFRPDEPVTRGEFLAMSLQVCGVEKLSDITRTGFYDDEHIPTWVKPYVSTALMSGLITGYKNGDGRLVFSSQSPITYSEASVILDNLLDITDVVSVSSVDPLYAPTWAYSATVNLAACNILPSGFSSLYYDSMTRAEAAEILLASKDLLEARESGGLLNWAR